MGVGKVIYAKLTGATAVAAILGTRVFPATDVPQETLVPYAVYQVNSNAPDKDLAGVLNGYVADVSVTFTTDTYADAQDLLRLATSALDSLDAVIAGVTVMASEVSDASDEINGPIDIDEAQVFQAELSVSLFYRES